MSVQPLERVVRVRLITSVDVDVLVRGARLVRVADGADPQVFTVLDLPADVPRLRVEGAGYLVAGAIDKDAQAALLAALTPGLRVTTVDATGREAVIDEVLLAQRLDGDGDGA